MSPHCENLNPRPFLPLHEVLLLSAMDRSNTWQPRALRTLIGRRREQRPRHVATDAPLDQLTASLAAFDRSYHNDRKPPRILRPYQRALEVQLRHARSLREAESLDALLAPATAWLDHLERWIPRDEV